MSKPYVIGIDIGGTNTVFGIVDARGQVVAIDSVKTLKHADFDDYIAELRRPRPGSEDLLLVYKLMVNVPDVK